jgi:hypothetical protein
MNCFDKFCACMRVQKSKNECACMCERTKNRSRDLLFQTSNFNSSLTNDSWTLLSQELFDDSLKMIPSTDYRWSAPRIAISNFFSNLPFRYETARERRHRHLVAFSLSLILSSGFLNGYELDNFRGAHAGFPLEGTFEMHLGMVLLYFCAKTIDNNMVQFISIFIGGAES